MCALTRYGLITSILIYTVCCRFKAVYWLKNSITSRDCIFFLNLNLEFKQNRDTKCNPPPKKKWADILCKKLFFYF